MPTTRADSPAARVSRNKAGFWFRGSARSTRSFQGGRNFRRRCSNRTRSGCSSALLQQDSQRKRRLRELSSVWHCWRRGHPRWCRRFRRSWPARGEVPCCRTTCSTRWFCFARQNSLIRTGCSHFQTEATQDRAAIMPPCRHKPRTVQQIETARPVRCHTHAGASDVVQGAAPGSPMMTCCTELPSGSSATSTRSGTRSSISHC